MTSLPTAASAGLGEEIPGHRATLRADGSSPPWYTHVIECTCRWSIRGRLTQRQRAESRLISLWHNHLEFESTPTDFHLPIGSVEKSRVHYDVHVICGSYQHLGLYADNKYKTWITSRPEWGYRWAVGTTTKTGKRRLRAVTVNKDSAIIQARKFLVTQERQGANVIYRQSRTEIVTPRQSFAVAFTAIDQAMAGDYSDVTAALEHVAEIESLMEILAKKKEQLLALQRAFLEALAQTADAEPRPEG